MHVLLGFVRGSHLAAGATLDFDILRLELAVGVVAERLFDRDGHAVEDVAAFLEDGVHFLEGPVTRLWVEEVDDGDDEEVAVRIVSLCI